MAGREGDAERLAANRNLCGGIAAVGAALGGLAQTAGAPLAVRIGFGGIAGIAAIAGLCFHLLERRAEKVGGTGGGRVQAVPGGELQPKTQRFVNRCVELSRLDEMLNQVEDGKGPAVAVLAGMPGVGKSAMAQHWAYNALGRFTDGALIANFSERRHGTAVDVSGMLASFIRKLGPPGVIVPVTLAERVECFRSMTADRKLLVYLDDVFEPAEVQQLRPSGRESLVIATSYRSMEELFYDGVDLIPLNPLTPERAKEMLNEIAGERGSAFDQSPTETEELVEFCGGLPLTLCVCASRLKLGRESLTVASVLAEVADEQRRLDYLGGTGEYAGAAVFGFAYADLTRDQRLVYRRLGLHPGLDLVPAHAALLTGLSPREAKAQLNALTGTYMLEPFDAERYRFHDLVRLHARESAAREDSEEECEALLSRLVDWYHGSLRKADWALITERLRLAPAEPVDVPHLPEFPDRDSAFAWLEAERANILAILQSARDHEWDERVWQMVEALWLFYYNRRHYADWIDATEIGIESTLRVGHRDAEARLRTQLAWALAELRHFDRAHVELDRANRIVRETGNLGLGGSVREFTGSCYLKEGEYDRAIDAFREAREVAVAGESNRGIALQDYFIGWALLEKGDYSGARDSLRASLPRMREAGDEMFVGRLLLRLGQASNRAGDPVDAETILGDALAALVPLDMRIEEAEAYEEMAALAQARNDRALADERRERAQAIYREFGHPCAGERADGSSSAVDPLAL